MEKKKLKFGSLKKINKKINSKEKKIPITRTEASSVVVGGEGSPIGGRRQRVAKSVARWCELKRGRMVRNEASRTISELKHCQRSAN